MEKMRRCFLVDPVCAMLYGHSLNSIYYFSDLCDDFFDQVETYVSMHLPIVDEKRPLKRFFNFYYHHVLPVNQVKIPPNLIKPSSFSSVKSLAVDDFRRLFVNERINSNDTIFLPSADYYSILALMNAVLRIESSERPNILIRLINVMENADQKGPSDVSESIYLLAKCIKEGVNIKVSAETPAYSRLIKAKTGLETTVTPYPAFRSSIMSYKSETPFTVLCGGSGREDKGFFRLHNIISLSNKIGDLGDIRFIVQNLRDDDQRKHISYLNSLYSIPNVELLSGTISYQEILEAYAESHISLMPYNEETYKYRGSAMLMESILYGRLSLGQTNTAFSEQIGFYNCGVSCEDDLDFAATIRRLSREDRSNLYSRSVMARDRYMLDVSRSYTNWIEGSVS